MLAATSIPTTTSAGITAPGWRASAPFFGRHDERAALAQDGVDRGQARGSRSSRPTAQTPRTCTSPRRRRAAIVSATA